MVKLFVGAAPVNGTKVAACLWAALSVSCWAAEAPGGTEESPISHWPMLTGSLAILLLFFTWWQQARHRQRMERANAELHQALEALTASETKFRLLFERSADSILLLDPSRGPKFVDCNEATVRMLGYKHKDEIVGLQPGMLSSELQPDGSPSVPAAAEMVRRAIQEGSYRFEWLTRRADNRLITTEVVMTPVQIKEKPLIVTVAREITERKRAEDSLREHQQLLSSVLDNISEAIYRSSPEEGLIFANKSYLAMFGYESLEDLRKVPRENLYARPEDRPKLLQQLEATGAFNNEEIEYKRKDGTTFWGLASSIAIYVPGTQKIDYHVGAITNITDRKRIEGQLRASEQRWRFLFEQSPLSVQIFAPTGQTIRVNASWQRLFNLREEEACCVNILEEPQLSGAADQIRRAFEGEVVHIPPVPFEVHPLPGREHGEVKWIGAILFPLLDPAGKVLEVVCIHEDITERKKAEDEVRELNQDLERRITERTAELRASEARLRTIVEHAPEAIVVFAADSGRFAAVNENAIRLYGRSREDLLELTPEDVSPELQADGRDSRKLAAEYTRQAMAGQTPVFEWLHKHAHGHTIPCEVRLVRLPSDGQHLIRASIIDTSERRRREKTQQATYQISEAVHTADDLENLYERIHNIIKTLMPADNLFLALHHPSTGLFHFDYYVDEVDPPPAPRQMSTGLTAYVFRTGKALLANRASMTDPQSEWRLAAGTPSAIWLGVPLAVRGKPLGVMAVQHYRDEHAYGEDEKQILTFVAEQIALAIERKRAEQALRESEQKHRALFEASSQGVLLHDEHQFLNLNPAALRIFGSTREEELLGKHPAETSAPIQLNGEPAEILARKHIADCMASGSARFEWLARSTEGKDIPVEIILTRIEMGGRPLIQAVMNDITERKKAEAELLRSLAREKELSALKSNFVSMVSHEFRTPLGIIMSSAEILDSYLEQLEPAERRDHLKSIQKNVRRMSSLMEEVLLLSRVEAGKLNFTPEEIDLPLFSQRLADEILSATNRRCPINLSIHWPVESAQADERLLRHILTNLLTNAVKYSPENSPVEFSLRLREGRALFEVRDRGIGIPEQDQKWLFNAFQRGGNVGQVPGTGLGLVIVKRCTELHGGTIHLESSPGQGTRAELELPITRNQSDTAIFGK